jgi:hypothetical protein
MKKPTPKVAVVSNSEAYWVSAGKKSREKSWFRKSAQGDRWSFCLTAGTLCLTNQEKQ